MKVLAAVILLSINLSVIDGAAFIPRGGKIVGGVEIDLKLAPYQVSLLYRSYHTCGGTNGVPASYLSVRAGSKTLQEGGKVFKVAKVFNHESFSTYDFDFDYALLQLATAIPLNGKTIAVIPLPKETDILDDETQVLVTGWGATLKASESNKILRGVIVPTINQQKCDTIYRYDGGISPRMICASSPGKDSCNGDSGGPMKRLSDGVLIGIVSFGMDCADATYPGVYSRVSAVRPWIKSVSGV